MTAGAVDRPVNPAEWNPYWLAYAVATHCHPADVFTRDAGHNAAYIAWIGARWREWGEETGRQGAIGEAEHAAFGAWLAARYTPPAAWGITR